MFYGHDIGSMLYDANFIVFCFIFSEAKQGSSVSLILIRHRAVWMSKVIIWVVVQWFDSEAKTPLIVACMDSNLIMVAQTLIDLGANVNAYRPGNSTNHPNLIRLGFIVQLFIWLYSSL